MSVTVEVDSTCTFSEVWLSSFADNTVPTSCADGTPVQIYIGVVGAAASPGRRLAMLKARENLPAGGVESCRAETGAWGSDGLFINAPVFQAGAQRNFDPDAVTVVSACF